MGWATSMVSPPDGSLGDFMASLKKLAQRPDDKTYSSAVEQLTVNQLVVGSIPTAGAHRKSNILRDSISLRKKFITKHRLNREFR